MKRAEKRNHLVEVAAALFHQHGYNGVGVDTIIEQAGVAKTTLYRHFPTKVDLIVAALRHEDEDFRVAMRSYVESKSTEPVDRLLATFDYLATWLRGTKFYGCPFMSAASEYSDSRDQVFREAQMHKKLVLAYFEELAHAINAENPGRLGSTINLMHEGAIAVSQITGNEDAAHEAKAAAKIAIERELA